MKVKGKLIGKTVAKQVKASDLYSDYLEAGKNGAVQKKILSQIIKLVIQDPESKFAEVLIKIAKRGDSRCVLAIEPLMEIFWQGDYEWQEDVVKLLGETAHLAPQALRIRVGLFLGHVSVSSVFVGGSGVDHKAALALSRISTNMFAAERAKIESSKRIIVRKEGDSRRQFDAETRSAAK